MTCLKEMAVSQKSIDLHSTWLEYLQAEFDQPYMQELKQFLLAEKQQGKSIYPSGSVK